MYLSSWLSAVFGRLKASNAGRQRRQRRHNLTAVVRQVELLEQRRMLTNAAPILSIEATALTWNESTPPVFSPNNVAPISPTLSVTDADSTNLQGAKVQITGNYHSSQDKLVFANTASITGSYDPMTGTLTLSGVDTVAHYTTALRSVAYTDISDAPITSVRTVSFQVTDDLGAASLSVTRSINVVPVNDPPVLVSPVTTLSYTEGTGAQPINTSLSISDPDSTTLSTGSITLSGYISTQDVLGFVPTPSTGNIVILTNTGGILRLVSPGAAATLGQWQSALRAVTYTNTSGNPTITPRVATFGVANGGTVGTKSNTVATTISLIAVNLPPVLGVGQSVQFTENGSPAIIDPSITVSDPDNTTFASGVVTITNFFSSQDVLGFVNVPATMGNIAILSNSGGQLKLESAGATATTAQWKAALASVTYSNTSENPDSTTRNVTFTINDGNSNSNALPSSVSVIPVNDSPVLAMTGAITFTEGDPATPINTGLTITDVDNTTLASATVQISNYVASEDLLGFVNVPATMGNIAVQSNTAGILTLVSTGATATLAQWAAALHAVTYSNSSGNPSTVARTVAFQVNDGSASLPSSNLINSTISITAVNTNPTLTQLEPTVLQYVEKATQNVSNSIVISDVDSPNISSATVQITGNFQNSQDILLFTNTANITGSFSSTTGILTLTGSDSVGNYQTALRSISYFNSSSDPNTSTRTVAFAVVDDTSLPSNSVKRDINVISVNDAPVLSGIESIPLQYMENTPPNYAVNNTTPVSATVQASDVDSMIKSATVKITSNYMATQDFLKFTNTANISGSWDSATGTLTLNGVDTPANYSAALTSVAYFNLQNNPGTLTRTVSYTVVDNGTASANSNTVSRDINVIAVNDPPLLTSGDSGALSYLEDAPPLPIMPNVLASDPDSDNLMSATIKITSNYNNGISQDALKFVNTPTITGSWDAVNGMLTLTGLDSVSNYRSALRTVAFANTHNAATTPPRTVSYFVTDDFGLNSNTISRDVNITTHPKSSVLSGIETTAKAYKANDPYTPSTPVTSSIVITDIDSPNLSYAVIKISNNYMQGQDQLVIDGSVANASQVYAAWNAATGELTLSGKVSKANYQSALRGVRYINTSPTPNTATRKVSYQVWDNSPGSPLPSNVVTRDVTVSTSNVAPFVSVNSGGALNYVEKDPATIVAPNLTIADTDSPNMVRATIKITGNYLSTDDSLIFTNTPKIQGSWNVATGTLTLIGLDTRANYQTALRSVKYVNSSSNPSTLPRTVSFTSDDGLATSNVATRSITIQPVNDPPLVATNAAAPLLYTPINGQVIVAPLLTVTDADSSDLAFAKIAISFNYLRGNDQLSFANTSKITGSFDVATGILTLSGTDSVSNYRAALQSVKYAYIGVPIPSTKTISFLASDVSNLSNVSSRDITVNP